MFVVDAAGQLRKCIEIAVKAHGNTLDNNSVPYIVHPMRVMAETSVRTIEQKCIAALHDIVEDTEVTFEDLASAKVWNRVIEGVRLLTRQEGESYKDFIMRIATSGNKDAIIVKLADIHDNLSPLRSWSNVGRRENLEARYKEAYQVLTAALNEMKLSNSEE